LLFAVCCLLFAGFCFWLLVSGFWFLFLIRDSVYYVHVPCALLVVFLPQLTTANCNRNWELSSKPLLLLLLAFAFVIF
jgi:hypothetical protein